MRRLALLLCVAAAAGCGRDETPVPAAADAAAAVAVTPTPAEDDQAVRNAHQTLAGAIANGNSETVAGALDEDFTWLTPTGVLMARGSVLAALPTPVIGSDSGRDVEMERYGADLMVVQRHSGMMHSMHVWVRRPVGWRLLHVSEVIEGDRVVYGGTMIGAADCVNPCRTVPFVPGTPIEKAVMEAWQAQQSGREEWARHIPEDNVARTSNGSYTKTDRIAVQQAQMRAGTVVAPSPLLYARIFESGDAALMLALQPRAAGKPFWGSRVFELRDATWMMVEGYQVTIQNAPPF